MHNYNLLNYIFFLLWQKWSCITLNQIHTTLHNFLVLGLKHSFNRAPSKITLVVKDAWDIHVDRLLNSLNTQQYELKNVMKSDQTAFATVSPKQLCEVLTKRVHVLKTVIKQLPPSVCVIVLAVTAVSVFCGLSVWGVCEREILYIGEQKQWLFY